MTAGPKLKTALLGCGRIGERHARILASSEQAELVGVADVEPAKAKAYASRHGGRTYRSLEELLAAERPDLIAVCTPSGLHAEDVLAAARAGVPNIVVEKPMALTLAAADAMIAGCEESGTR